jgi:hypothetical protein
MAQIDAVNARERPALRDRIEQVRLGMWLDSHLYFNDLWTWFHYNRHMTIYSPALATYNWGPRSVLPDYDYEVDLNEVRSLRHYPAEDSPPFRAEMAQSRRFLDHFTPTRDGIKLDEAFLADADRAVRDYPVTDYAASTLITIIGDSPFYLDRLAPGERERLAYRRAREIAILEKNGYRTVTLDHVLAEDFGDRPHLNTLGGDKLADKVAARIKSLGEKDK